VQILRSVYFDVFEIAQMEQSQIRALKHLHQGINFVAFARKLIYSFKVTVNLTKDIDNIDNHIDNFEISHPNGNFIVHLSPRLVDLGKATAI
jgi:hypothetical protein